jgi:hypothetical protein
MVSSWRGLWFWNWRKGGAATHGTRLNVKDLPDSALRDLNLPPEIHNRILRERSRDKNLHRE